MKLVIKEKNSIKIVGVKVSVIIVNYNVKYFLEQALLSVRKALQWIDGEVWVVDNNSVDGSIALVEEKFPEVKLIANKENIGFSRANNQAMLQAKGEYLLLLNPDTVIEELTLKKVCDFMDKTPNAGALGVKMIDGKGRFLPESKRGLPTPAVAFFKMFGLSALFPKSKVFGKYHLGYLDKNKIHIVDVLSGAFMLLRKEALDKIGLLDETFFMYGEDIDLSYRVKLGGYQNYYFPETTIIHYKGESTKKTSVNYVFVFYRAMVIFAKKHYSKGSFRAFSFFIHAAIWFRAGLDILIRFAKNYRLVFLDALLLFVLSYFLKIYWEQNHKFVLGGTYPPEYLYINVSFYLLCWLSALWFSGVYKKESNLRNLFYGMFAGTIAIAVGYAFAPDNLRFSRALILLSAVIGAFLLSFYRLLFHFVKHKSFDYGKKIPYNTLIIGEPEEAQRVSQLLKQSDVPHALVGFVSVNEHKKTGYLGTLAQLKELVSIFKVTELIFCSKDMAASEIIAVMSSLNSETLNYKIVPEESLFVIGSNSKNTNGELYTISLKPSFSESKLKQQKRSLDIFISALLGLSFPLGLVFVKNRRNFIANIVLVIKNKATWVGYQQPVSNTIGLPELPPGILSVSGKSQAEAVHINSDTINRFYVKNYSWQHDLLLVLSNFRELGV